MQDSTATATNIETEEYQRVPVSLTLTLSRGDARAMPAEHVTLTAPASLCVAVLMSGVADSLVETAPPAHDAPQFQPFPPCLSGEDVLQTAAEDNEIRPTDLFSRHIICQSQDLSKDRPCVTVSEMLHDVPGAGLTRGQFVMMFHEPSMYMLSDDSLVFGLLDRLPAITPFGELRLMARKRYGVEALILAAFERVQ